MSHVFIQPRPKSAGQVSPIAYYAVEDDADHVLRTFNLQGDAIRWAKRQGHRPLIARTRHLSDKRIPGHWREA